MTLNSRFVFSATLLCAPLFAQTTVTAVPDAEALVKDSDPKLEANKRLIYNLFREILEARHMELADKYLAPNFIQHNPNAADGLDALKKYFANSTPQPIAPKLKRPIAAMIAEGDMVAVFYPRELTDPKDKTKKYTTAGFDLYRIQNGRVVEHWDAATRAE
jgi:predicted SnoaL-like aldol condensation-catalyzing enzyme